MKKTFLLLSCLFSVYAYGQFSFPYYELEPSWEIERYDPYTNINEEISIKLGQDTSFCGHVWNSVNYIDQNTNSFIERIGYCRQENKKVFVRKNADCNEDEFLMYDFGVESGDTIYCGVSFGFATLPVMMTVVNTQTVWIKGLPRKLIGVTYLDPFYFPVLMIWVEGVGDNITHPFYSLDCQNCGEIQINYNCFKLNDRFISNALYTAHPCSPTVDTIYVNKNLAGGNNNGLDWDNAFYDLQDALSIADSGDVVLVAKGIYFPTADSNRESSFLMPNGVSLYGGFVGNETTIDQRDFTTNQTILSGDIGIPDDNTDNSYHILFSIGADSATIVDGFIIEKGMANHPSYFSPHSKGGGYYLNTNDQNPATNPRISNCIFRENAAGEGGAIYCDGQIGLQALNNISDCVFMDNFATSNGGAIHKRGGKIGAVAKLENCKFIENKGHSGGAIFMKWIIGVQAIENCLFQSDTSTIDGGAIFLELLYGDTEIRIIDCDFNNNNSHSGGAISSIYVGNGNNGDSLSYVFDSCRFNNNSTNLAEGGAVAIFDSGNMSSVYFNNTIFENNESFNWGAGLMLVAAPYSKNYLKINSCIFSNNFVTNSSFSGAIYYDGDGNGVNPLSNNTEITNSLFYGNGGALAFSSGALGSVETKVSNCTFFNNGEYPIGKNWSPNFDSMFFNNMHIENSIIWENTPAGKLFFNGNFADLNIHDYTINNCLVNVPDCVVDGVDGCSEGMIYEEYPMFLDTLNHDFRLLECSPAINAGNNDFVSSENTLDLNQQARILDDIVDMGAYEQPALDIEINYSLQNATTVNTFDGFISIDSTSGNNMPYSFLWSNEDTTTFIGNLSPGDYFLTITAANGCERKFVFEISATNSTGDFLNNIDIPIYPNPAKDVVNIDVSKLNSKSELYLFNHLGQRIYEAKNVAPAIHKINVGNFYSGIYYLKIKMGDFFKLEKIIID